MWTEPKTDWSSQSFFSAEDYNRIKNNLEHLRELASGVHYIVLPWSVMGEDVTPIDYPYADMINRIENNLETLAEGTYKLDVGEKQQFVPLGAFISAEELNRIERAELKLYYMLLSQRDCQYRLAYRLGSERGVRI